MISKEVARFARLISDFFFKVGMGIITLNFSYSREFGRPRREPRADGDLRGRQQRSRPANE